MPADVECRAHSLISDLAVMTPDAVLLVRCAGWSTRFAPRDASRKSNWADGGSP
jgi:hypothetical protein